MAQSRSNGHWWYEHGGRRQGPVALDRLEALLQAGSLMPAALVWTAGLPQWVAAQSVPLLAKSLAQAEPPPLPASAAPDQTADEAAAIEALEEQLFGAFGVSEADDKRVLAQLKANFARHQQGAARAALPPALPPQPAAGSKPQPEALQAHRHQPPAPQPGLAPDLRRKYVKRLARRHETWAGFAGLVAWAIALRVLGIESWVAGVLLLLLLPGAALTLAEYWETQRLEGLSDALVEHEHQEALDREKQRKLISSLAWIMGIAAVAMVLALNDKLRTRIGQALQLAASSAQCQVEGSRQTPETFILNGSPDFGYEVQAVVRNAGKDGAVRVTAVLKLGQPAYRRSEQLHLAAGASRNLRFQFPEPDFQLATASHQIRCN